MTDKKHIPPGILAGAMQDPVHRSTGRVRPAQTARTKHIPMPPNAPEVFNASDKPCDMLQGPCCCGAWHHLADWPDVVKGIMQRNLDTADSVAFWDFVSKTAKEAESGAWQKGAVDPEPKKLPDPDDHKSSGFWATADKASAEVADWPVWKREGAGIQPREADTFGQNDPKMTRSERQELAELADLSGFYRTPINEDRLKALADSKICCKSEGCGWTDDTTYECRCEEQEPEPEKEWWEPPYHNLAKAYIARGEEIGQFGEERKRWAAENVRLENMLDRWDALADHGLDNPEAVLATAEDANHQRERAEKAEEEIERLKKIEAAAKAYDELDDPDPDASDIVYWMTVARKHAGSRILAGKGPDDE